MDKLVIVSFDLYCTWDGKAPWYRVYVNNELQTERTYKFNNASEYLNERLPLYLTSGQHTIRIESLGVNALFRPANLNIDTGSARILDQDKLLFEVHQ